eukprot:341067-Amphidinium_carterae.3
MAMCGRTWRARQSRHMHTHTLAVPYDVELLTAEYECRASAFAFGRGPKVPLTLLSDETHGEQQLYTLSAEAKRRQTIRLIAERSFLELDMSTHYKRALLRKSVPYRGDFSPGDRRCFWRQQVAKNVGGKKKLIPPCWIPATIMGVQGPNAWASSQCRSAVGWENWSGISSIFFNIARG